MGTRESVTKRLTDSIFNQTRKMGTFGCFEVTIGFGGSERVDYITYNTRGDIHCYEVKSSKEDFYSDAKWSFVGHYNYFVMTEETYEQVKHDIPKGIGVYIDGHTMQGLNRENSNMRRQIRRSIKDKNMLSHIRHIINFEKDEGKIKDKITKIFDEY